MWGTAGVVIRFFYSFPSSSPFFTALLKNIIKYIQMYNCTSNIYKKLWAFNGASPVARWPRIHLSMQEMYRRPGFIPWVRKIPWRKKWQPTLVFLPGESQGQMSLHGVAKSQTQLSTHNTRTWTFNIYDLMSLDHFLFSMAHGPSPSTEQQKTYGKKKSLVQGTLVSVDTSSSAGLGKVF